MSFFDTIFINTISILFPVFIYLIFLVYRNGSENNMFDDSIYEIILVSTIFLIIKLNGDKNGNYVMLFLNIPILFAYLKCKKNYALFLSGLLVVYFSYTLNFNVIVIILEYICYYLFYLCESKKNIEEMQFINYFTLIKALFFSFYMFYNNMDAKLFTIFTHIFIYIILFYSFASLCYVLLSKGEELVYLNNSLKSLEKEKTLRNSLFKLTHEIKNPIAVCKGYLDMLDLDNKISSIKYVNIIKGEIERTLVLMDDFLDYTKVKVNKSIMDVNYLLEDTVSSLSSLFKNKEVKTNFKIKDEEVYINGDYNRLKQVLVNIFKNSIEAKKKGQKPSIKLRTKKIDGNYIITISDDGIGMDMEELNNIGKAFYTTKLKGTGLGVLLSKEIIELHEGKLIYTSAKGSGTSVDIVLPILDL